jgi:hypothetical protein
MFHFFYQCFRFIFLFAVILLQSPQCVFAQSKSIEPCLTIFDTLTQMEVFTTTIPTVAGGRQALGKEISKRIKYPHLPHYPDDSKVIVAFVIDKDGHMKGKRILKDIEGTDLGKQLLDIIDDMTWHPATCEGKVVPTIQMMPLIVDIDP